MPQTPTYHRDPAYAAEVERLATDPTIWECVALLRAGMAWRDALSLEPQERLAILRVYAEQEDMAWREAQRRAGSAPAPPAPVPSPESPEG